MSIIQYEDYAKELLSLGVTSKRGVAYAHSQKKYVISPEVGDPDFPRVKSAFKKIPVGRAAAIAKMANSLDAQMWIATNDNRVKVRYGLSCNPKLHPEVGVYLCESAADLSDLSLPCRILHSAVDKLPAERMYLTKNNHSAWNIRIDRLVTSEGREFAEAIGAQEGTVPILGLVLLRKGLKPVIDVIEQHLTADDESYSVALHRLAILGLTFVHDFAWTSEEWHELMKLFQQKRVMPISSVPCNGFLESFPTAKSRNAALYSICKLHQTLSSRRRQLFPEDSFYKNRNSWIPSATPEHRFYEFVKMMPEEMMEWCQTYVPVETAPYIHAIVGAGVPITEETCLAALEQGELALLSQLVSRDIPEGLRESHQKMLVRYVDLYLQAAGVNVQADMDQAYFQALYRDVPSSPRVLDLWYYSGNSHTEWVPQMSTKSLLVGLDDAELRKFAAFFIIQSEKADPWVFTKAYRRDLVYTVLRVSSSIPNVAMQGLLERAVCSVAFSQELSAEQLGGAVQCAAPYVTDWPRVIDAVCAAFDNTDENSHYFAVFLSAYIDQEHNASAAAFEAATQLLQGMTSCTELLSTLRSVI